MTDERKKTTDELNVNYCTFEQVKNKVDELCEKHNLTYADFEMSYSSDYDCYYPMIEFSRLETDLEMKRRIDKEALFAKQKEERDLKEYKLLKKKFEGTNA